MTCRKEDRLTPSNEIEITPEMLDVEEYALRSTIGDPPGINWDARDLAEKVYRATVCPDTAERY